MKNNVNRRTLNSTFGISTLVAPFLISLFVFWYLRYPGHLLLIEERSYFDGSGEFFLPFLTRPGGLSAYLGAFVSQFYRWQVVGALLQSLFMLLIWFEIRSFGLQIRKNGLPVISTTIVLLLGILQTSTQWQLTDTFQMLFFVTALRAAFYVNRTRASRWYGLFLMPLWILLFPPIILLLFLFALYGIRRMQGGDSALVHAVLSIVLALILLRGCQLFLFPFPNSNYVAVMSEGGTNNILKFLLPVYLVFPIATFVRSYLPERNLSLRLNLILFVLLPLITFTTWRTYFDESAVEDCLRMGQAANKGEWNEILRLASNHPVQSQEMLFFTNLACANQGILPEKLFDNPQNNSQAFKLDDKAQPIRMVWAAELYKSLGVYNAAMQMYYEANTGAPQGVNFRNLRALISLYIRKGEFVLARKYIKILSRSTLHDSWVKTKIQEIRKLEAAWDSEFENQNSKGDFFFGARPFLSDLARLLDRDGNNTVARDYLLCTLLLNKDLDRFFSVLEMIGWKQQQMPRVYEEAVLMAIQMGNQRVMSRNYPIRPQTRNHFNEFLKMKMVSQNQGIASKQLFDRFKNTLWYHCQFN